MKTFVLLYQEKIKYEIWPLILRLLSCAWESFCHFQNNRQTYSIYHFTTSYSIHFCQIWFEMRYKKAIWYNPIKYKKKHEVLRLV